MKKITLFLMTLVLSLMVNAQTAKKHEVQSGETIYSIARLYNVTASSIIQLNPGIDADHIMAGQTINVPTNAQQTVVTQQPVQQNIQQNIQQQVLQQVRQQVQAQTPQETEEAEQTAGPEAEMQAQQAGGIPPA